MPKRIDSKPCRKCGAPVAGHERSDRKAQKFPQHCENCRGRPRGAAHPRWTGGRVIGGAGYAYVRRPPDIPGRSGYILEHRLVWARAKGPIPPKHHIHHKNGVKVDNRLENLELICPADHNHLHFAIGERWSRHYDACVECGKSDSKHNARGVCSRCMQAKAYQPKPRLRMGWSIRYAACVECGTTERRHKYHGLCNRCAWHARRSVGRSAS